MDSIGSSLSVTVTEQDERHFVFAALLHLMPWPKMFAASTKILYYLSFSPFSPSFQSLLTCLA